MCGLRRAGNAVTERYYLIGWVPARADDNSTLLVYDLDKNAVVHFERTPAANQITRVYETSVTFNNALVRAIDGSDEAMLSALELKGVDVDRVTFTRQEQAAAYENLALLIHNRVISYPYHPELIAELDVFKSDFTYSEAPDYSLQVAQQSGIHALCLATTTSTRLRLACRYDEVYYSYDRDLIGIGGRNGGDAPIRGVKSIIMCIDTLTSDGNVPPTEHVTSCCRGTAVRVTSNQGHL